MKTLHNYFNIPKDLIHTRDNLTVCQDDCGFVLFEFHCEETEQVLDTICISPIELAYINMLVNGLTVMPEPPKPLWQVTLFGFTLSVGRV